MPDDTTFKNVVILTTSVIKNDGKLYPQVFLEEALFAKWVCNKEIKPFLLMKSNIKSLVLF